MFIINLTYIKPLEVIDQLFEAHKEFLEQYYNSGQFLISGAKNPRIGGIIIAIGSNKKELEKIIQQDPFIKEKAATYEVIEFIPRRFNHVFDSIKEKL
ncbi:YCII-related domain protein [Rickettsiales bacterium Ac37b]|nr:YCII-related domain protein [Rickettsiales bacterium Ac37b]